MDRRAPEHLTVESANRDLVGRVFHPLSRSSQGSGIIFIHGWESSQRSYRPRAEKVSGEIGATCLTFDLSGHGESGDLPASFTPREHLTNSLAAFDALAKMDAVDPLRIGICGASYGAYLAAMVTSRRATAALLLRAPALYPDSELDIPGGSRHTRPEIPDDAEPLRDLADFNGQVLIVESEHDEAIPHEVIRAYLAACPRAGHALIPGAAHAMTDPRWNDVFVEQLLKWATEL